MGGNRTDLLSKAYSWSTVEWKEYERVWDEVFLQPIVKESFWIKFMSCTNSISNLNGSVNVRQTIRSPEVSTAMHHEHRISHSNGKLCYKCMRSKKGKRTLHHLVRRWVAHPVYWTAR